MHFFLTDQDACYIIESVWMNITLLEIWKRDVPKQYTQDTPVLYIVIMEKGILKHRVEELEGFWTILRVISYSENMKLTKGKKFKHEAWNYSADFRDFLVGKYTQVCCV